jgi:hypothetical protein
VGIHRPPASREETVQRRDFHPTRVAARRGRRSTRDRRDDRGGHDLAVAAVRVNWSSTSTSARARSVTWLPGTRDARRAKLLDRCAAKDGIVPFDELVEQFMTQEPYNKAQRVFVIVHNGSAHRGQRSIDRLQGVWPNLILVHTPVHASWLNQAEIYFSVTQRKVLQPNNFADLDTLERTLLAFGRRYEEIAKPFEWKFTRQDLNELLARLHESEPPLQLAA